MPNLIRHTSIVANRPHFAGTVLIFGLPSPPRPHGAPCPREGIRSIRVGVVSIVSLVWHPCTCLLINFTSAMHLWGEPERCRSEIAMAMM